MDFKNHIFDAISNGDLIVLKVCFFFLFCFIILLKILFFQNLLNDLPKNEIKVILSSKFDGTTPLLVAARNGHCHILEHLITNCEADVEQVFLEL